MNCSAGLGRRPKIISGIGAIHRALVRTMRGESAGSRRRVFLAAPDRAIAIRHGIDGDGSGMLHCGYRSALVSEFVMNAVVDRILNTYQLMRPLDPDQVSDSRRKITQYIESLASAGHSDAQQLAVYGLAYLKELHEGRDPRFTGC
jgi:hypothetical protein